MNELRWYQRDAISAIYNYFETNNGNPLVCIPTGAGKTRVFCEFIYSALAQFPDTRIISATHVKELIGQGVQTLRAIWPNAPVGIYSAGLGYKEHHAPITFAGIASIYNAIERFGKINIFIIDEAHLLGDDSDGMYLSVIKKLRELNPKMKVIGFTATGWRTGMGRLTNGPIFTDTIFDICNVEGFARLFSDNHLVRPRPQRVKNIIDTSGIAINNGDFAQGALANAASKKITWAALNEALAHGQDRYCRLVFCAGVQRVVMTCEMLKSFGLRVAAVHSNTTDYKMSSKERDAIILAYRNGELDTLVVNGIGTTGLDVPRIDHIIQLRPTLSVGLHVQMIGREMRPYESNGWIKQDALFSDHAGNTRRLGTIDDPKIPKIKGVGGGEMPVKICDACECYNNLSARVCVFCGEIFDIKFNVAKTAYADEIIKTDYAKYEWFPVTHVYYTQHFKRNATLSDKPTIRADYFCGKKKFTEFVAVETGNQFLKRKFAQWWRQRVLDPNMDIPATVAQALQFIDKLAMPKRIEVWINKDYPEIMQYEY